ncbi:MAG: hypothetical protein IJX26_00995 [Clostridia bacterium]|nr:hypothetical protein [Clostridia bacterium]
MTQLEDDDEIETIEKHSFVYNKLNGIYKDIINDINFDKNIKLFLSCLSEELIDINYFNESSMTEREMKLVQKMLEKLV